MTTKKSVHFGPNAVVNSDVTNNNSLTTSVLGMSPHIIGVASSSSCSFSGADVGGSHIAQNHGFSPQMGNPTFPSTNMCFQYKHSPPFRTGGRGSKQLSKAIENSAGEKQNQYGVTGDMWVLHTGDPIYFAKVVSFAQDPSSVLIQKMQPSHIDPALLVPWEGHLMIAKIETLQSIQV